ncbi:UDP-N-acetylmuramoyl-L-alanine--D-glutamate ligase [Psychromicrobium xiongbiense]|uniref:UDP-N-acetylmuramoyl-L-alanine--D-glutamate ligase n=1 Tax=Psychromicrobium xiongbiense TaxID=3051184 RepID=UPI002557BED5|nr:UDP-N-acetylmuramoyl-L-alanine--D-glutamate ligase [Psychromicrobium sp. YIM S02556]
MTAEQHSELPHEYPHDPLLDERLAALHGWEADWAGLRVVVTGLGATGFSIADTLIELGAVVVVVADTDDDAARAAADTLTIVGASAVLLGPDHATVLPLVAGEPAQLVVTSPGLRPSSPLLAQAQAAGIPIWGDIELAWRLRGRPGARHPQWLTITGTNGKTTTTTMTALMLQAAGVRAVPAGNIGTPILDVIRDLEGYDAVVVELSSFQLHWTRSVSAVASVCLNLAEDHVDWHGSMEGYRRDKARIYHNTQRACVYNVEDRATERMVEEAEVEEGCRAVGFTTGTPGLSMVGVVEGLLVDRAFHEERRREALELAQLSDAGQLVPKHLAANAAAAAALVRAYGVAPEAVSRGLKVYAEGYHEHRIQPVARHEGVLWVNDSKATNPHAAAASLAAFNPVVWIAGGDGKGVGYDELIQEQAARLKAVVLIGVNREPLLTALERHAPNVPVLEIEPGDTGRVMADGSTQPRSASAGESGAEVMARAVRSAATLATMGDTVLMAPAAASLDQFPSYAHRGQAFIDAVRDLVEGQAPANGKPE